MKGANAIKYLALLVLILCAHPTSSKPTAAGKIKHVIVLMEENRSFDHMFGWFKGVNGLNGTEYNLVNVSNPNSEKVYVDDQARFVAPCDPDHSTPATTFKVFGSTSDAGVPNMGGFVEWEDKNGNLKTNHCAIMSMQSPSHLPIMSALASEFVLMDRFFCAHPGPTWPNRLFMLLGTSAGCTETGTYYKDKKGALYPQQTIFDQVDAAGLTWKNYYNDTPWELFIESIAKHPENQANMEQFYEDARTGNLPSFAWINPRAGMNVTLRQGSNDQHPDHDVALGERYYKDIYEALRSSPAWNETLYIVTYDEHGGFYDHVLPPKNIPPPNDNETSYPDKGVLFNRLGVRIPTLLVSPWLPKGLVLSEPPVAQKPATNSEYTLTSIMATARILLGMPTTPLTDRDAWSATFEHLFGTYTAPRTDCPLHLPAPPPPATLLDEENLPVNGLQRDIMEMHANLAGVPFPSQIKIQGEVSEWLQAHYNIHKENAEQWKVSKTRRTHAVAALASPTSATLWTVNKGTSDYFTLSTNNHQCLDYSESGIVGVSSCFPRADADVNADSTQQWQWHEDASIRSSKDASKCLTSHNTCTVRVQACEQHFQNQKWMYEDGAIKLIETQDVLTVVQSTPDAFC